MGKHVRQESNAPTRKVAAGSVGGAVATLVVFIAGQFGTEVPGEVAGALATVLAFVFAYFVPERG